MARPRPEPGAASSARTPLRRTASLMFGTMPSPSSSTMIADAVRRVRRSASTSIGGHDTHHDCCARPFAGIVHEVAQHLVEILSLSANGHVLGHLHVDGDAALGVQADATPAPGRRPSPSRSTAHRPSLQTPRRGRARGGSPPVVACARLAGRLRPPSRAGPRRGRVQPRGQGSQAASSNRGRDRRTWRWRAESPARDARAARSGRRPAAGPRRDRRRPSAARDRLAARSNGCAGCPPMPGRPSPQPVLRSCRHTAVRMTTGLCNNRWTCMATWSRDCCSMRRVKGTALTNSRPTVQRRLETSSRPRSDRHLTIRSDSQGHARSR